jgi:hypothetical protein
LFLNLLAAGCESSRTGQANPAGAREGANGTAREIGAEEIDNYVLRLVSWRVATRPKAAEKE